MHGSRAESDSAVRRAAVLPPVRGGEGLRPVREWPRSSRDPREDEDEGGWGRLPAVRGCALPLPTLLPASLFDDTDMYDTDLALLDERIPPCMVDVESPRGAKTARKRGASARERSAR